MSTKKTTRDMTVGRPSGLILSFALPLMLGSLFQQMYSMADTIIVGKILGVQSLAAVGSCGSLQFLIIGFCLGSCAGMAIPIAQRFGAKDEEGLHRYLANAIWLALIMAAVVTTVTTILGRRILGWMQTPADIVDEAYSYFIIILCGIPFMILYNFSSAIMRALGDSKHPLLFLIFSSFLNIGLDLLFILGFKLGCAGAAYATILSQLISGILCVRYIYKNMPILRMKKEEMVFSGKRIGVLAYMGFPMGLQNSLTSVGTVLLSSAVNGLGSIAVASMTAAGKVQMIFNCVYDAMGNAMATYAGQNLGARKLSRIGKGIRFSLTVMISYSFVALVAINFLGRYVALMFVDASETVILNNVQTFLRINSAMAWLLASLIILRYSIQGLGYSNYALFAGMFEMVARSTVALVLVKRFGFLGACFGNGAAWVAANVFLIPCYLFVKRKVYRKVEEVPDESYAKAS